MSETSDYIRHKLRIAREATSLSQYDLADMFGSVQGTISGIERGRVQVSAADLARLAKILSRPITYFFPDADLSELSDAEQQLIHDFRKLPSKWQDTELEHIAAQLELLAMTEAQEQTQTDTLIVRYFALRQERASQDSADYIDEIESEFETGMLTFASEPWRKELGDDLSLEQLLGAVSSGVVTTPAEAAHRLGLEQRLLELWRQGRLAWVLPNGPDIFGFDLDSELGVVKAWELGQLRLLDEPTRDAQQ